MFSKDNLLLTGFIVAFMAIAGVVVYQKNYGYRKLPYYSFQQNTEEYTTSETPPTHKVGNFSFYDQTGKEITQSSVANTIHIVDYIFTTCPGICKVMTVEMQDVYKEFKANPNIKILSHTSKPEEDSIPVLKRYAESKGIYDTDRWLFLTGDKKELQRMAYEQYGIINKTDLQEEGSFVHTEMFVLVDKNNFIRGYYDGTSKAEVGQLIRDVQELLKEQF